MHSRSYLQSGNCRTTDGKPDAHEQRNGDACAGRTLWDGFRFCSSAVGLPQPDCIEWANSYFHVCIDYHERLLGNVHIWVRNAARQCSMQFQPGERDGRCQFSGQCHGGGGDRRNSQVSSQCRSIKLVPGTPVRRFDSVAPGMAAEAEDSHDCCLIRFPRGRRVKLYGFGRRFGRNCHRRARKIEYTAWYVFHSSERFFEWGGAQGHADADGGLSAICGNGRDGAARIAVSDGLYFSFGT